MSKIIKTVTITIEEETIDGRIEQSVNFEATNLSKFELLGVFRLYEQQTSLSLLKEADASPQS
jgi:hypothetical protein